MEVYLLSQLFSSRASAAKGPGGRLQPLKPGRHRSRLQTAFAPQRVLHSATGFTTQKTASPVAAAGVRLPRDEQSRVSERGVRSQRDVEASENWVAVRSFERSRSALILAHRGQSGGRTSLESLSLSAQVNAGGFEFRRRSQDHFAPVSETHVCHGHGYDPRPDVCANRVGGFVPLQTDVGGANERSEPDGPKTRGGCGYGRFGGRGSRHGEGVRKGRRTHRSACAGPVARR